MPKPILLIAISMGLDSDPDEDDIEEIDKDDDKEQIVKGLLELMKRANKKEYEENNK